MSAAHEELAAFAPAYVLGALDADEHRAFAAHLAECPICESDVRSLMPVVEAIGQAVRPAAPSLAVRRHVLDAVASHGSGSTVGGQYHDRPSVIPSWLPLAALLVVSIGLGTYVMTLRARIVDLEVRLDEAAAQLAAATRATTEARRVAFEAQSMGSVLTAPDLVRIDLIGQAGAPHASARALWSRARGMVFSARDLPPLPAGRVYQVWVVTADTQISAGLLMLDDAGRGVGVFATPPDIAPVAVAVTDEPAGGMSRPTGSMYLVGKTAGA